MNTFKYSLVILLGAIMFVSCKEDNSFVNDVQDGPNLVIFTNPTVAVNKVSDGTAYDVAVQVKVSGPHLQDVPGDVTAKIEPTLSGIPDSTYVDSTLQKDSTYSYTYTELRAKQGTNFSIPTNTVTLKESNNYLDTFHFKMLTQGITAPLAVSPQLKLKVTETSGGEGVVNSGKPITVTLNYACPSQIQGTYDMTINGYTHPNEIVSAQPGLGQYVTQSVEYFFPEGPRGAFLPRGVLFSDVCGKLTVPSQILGNFYSNVVTGTGSVDPAVGAQDGSLDSFTLNYNVDGLGDFTVKFTKK